MWRRKALACRLISAAMPRSQPCRSVSPLRCIKGALRRPAQGRSLPLTQLLGCLGFASYLAAMTHRSFNVNTKAFMNKISTLIIKIIYILIRCSSLHFLMNILPQKIGNICCKTEQLPPARGGAASYMCGTQPPHQTTASTRGYCG